MLSERLLGRRVVLRYRRAVDDGLPPLSDLVGELVALDGDHAAIQARTGLVRVPRADIVLARPVAASRREILALQRISRLGWRAAEAVELDGWLLHADLGWTGRANSALPLATPTRPLNSQLADVAAFYAERGLPVQVQVPLPARGLLDAELAGRCWTVARRSVVLVRGLADPLPGEPAADAEVRLAEAPDDRWLAGYHYRGGALPEFARALLTRHDRVTFATAYHRGRAAGIGRGTVDLGWLGITAIEVEPDLRRRGLARLLMQALMDWGAGQGATRCYLQVDESNTAALAMYERLGFIEHHRYHYRLPPAGGGA